MELVIPYAGGCRSPTHASWLMNICDRQALRQLATQGCYLYHQSLSTCIQNHFADILGHLNEQDASAATEAPEEEPQGATAC